MMFGFGSAFVGYLAAAGLATNAAVVGRGLVGSARLAAQGRLAEAGVQALAAVASPAVMAAASASDLVGEVIDAALRVVGAGLAAGEADVAWRQGRVNADRPAGAARSDPRPPHLPALLF